MELTQNVTPKREKWGRWNPAETQLFEVLVERYGKNWKKIQSSIKGRTLAQVRSHGQKFFERVGPKKTEEYERRAKLIEAVEVLKLENVWVEQGKICKDNSDKKEEEEKSAPEAIVKEQFLEGQRMVKPQKSSENMAYSHSISNRQTRPSILTPIICYPRVNYSSNVGAQPIRQQIPDVPSQNH